jgi:glycosyltransferase involved in cell wall biosynthesis
MSRISLCVICGNESEHIAAMLNSFAPCFDELSLVRAIGKREPDDTMQQAQAWCAANGKAFLFCEYRNGFTARDWDHVDSFGAARNQAFRQATGDWLIWADCDDTSEGADKLRADLSAIPADVSMVRYAYDVRGSGKKLMRERAIRAAAFRDGRMWHHAVHENLLILPGDKHEDRHACVWVHSPNSVKRENRRRNLRILGNSVIECATQYFYIHQEHYCNQDKQAAEQFGKLALQFPNLQPSFRYETLLNLARICGNYREAMTYCMEAHGIFPWCREAVAAMILLHFEKGDGRRATWWADRMLDLPEPAEAERPWTHEAKYYGWAGFDIAARAHRMAENVSKASELQRKFHAGVTPTISLIHATRGRSTKAVGCRESWMNTAANPWNVEHVFAVDSDDKESVAMAKQFVSVTSHGRSCVAAWNLAAKSTRGDLIVQLSDDWLPSPNWDLKLLDLVKGRDLAREQIVIAVNDGNRRDDLLCMAILSRGRLETQGALFFEGYESVFSDNEFSVRAFADGVVIDARDKITFEHAHPAFGKAPMDKTYEHNNSSERYKAGKALFDARNPSK